MKKIELQGLIDAERLGHAENLKELRKRIRFLERDRDEIFSLLRRHNTDKEDVGCGCRCASPAELVAQLMWELRQYRDRLWDAEKQLSRVRNGLGSYPTSSAIRSTSGGKS